LSPCETLPLSFIGETFFYPFMNVELGCGSAADGL
jgi:hypothetical protein